MRSHYSRVTSAIWIVLGSLGVFAAVWDMSHMSFEFRGAYVGDVLFFTVSITAIVGGVAAWKKFRLGRYVLCRLAILTLLYCVAFQLMVSAEFGWFWFTATIALFVFSVLTLWSQSRPIDRT